MTVNLTAFPRSSFLTTLAPLLISVQRSLSHIASSAPRLTLSVIHSLSFCMADCICRSLITSFPGFRAIISKRPATSSRNSHKSKG